MLGGESDASLLLDRILPFFCLSSCVSKLLLEEFLKVASGCLP